MIIKEVILANRLFTSQFIPNFERQPVMLMGSILQTDLGDFATLVASGITYLAKTMGAAGNSITIALVAGGTAGAEVVTVTGTAISVQIESAVSTRTQVKTAIDGNTAAAALISVSVASGGTAATLVAATPLASGDDTDFTVVGCKGFVVTQTGTGVYKIALANSYSALLSADIMLLRAAAVDLMPQLQSQDVSAASQSIVFRMQAAATPTNMANSDQLFIKLMLRNSSTPS